MENGVKDALDADATVLSVFPFIDMVKVTEEYLTYELFLCFIFIIVYHAVHYAKTKKTGL